MLASNSNVRPTFEEAGPPDKHDSLEMLFERTPIERAVPGKTIIFEGDRAEHVFAVYSGYLRICRQLNDGRRVITGFLAAGDIVGVSFKNRYLYSVEAINEVLFQRQSRNSFERRLQSSPQLRPFVLSKLCDEVLQERGGTRLRVPPGPTEKECRGGRRKESCQSSDDSARHRRLSRHDNRDGVAHDH